MISPVDVSGEEQEKTTAATAIPEMERTRGLFKWFFMGF
jgi:hypothetical protein